MHRARTDRLMSSLLISWLFFGMLQNLRPAQVSGYRNATGERRERWKAEDRGEEREQQKANEYNNDVRIAKANSSVCVCDIIREAGEWCRLHSIGCNGL